MTENLYIVRKECFMIGVPTFEDFQYVCKYWEVLNGEPPDATRSSCGNVVLSLSIRLRLNFPLLVVGDQSPFIIVEWKDYTFKEGCQFVKVPLVHIIHGERSLWTVGLKAPFTIWRPPDGGF